MNRPLLGRLLGHQGATARDGWRSWWDYGTVAGLRVRVVTVPVESHGGVSGRLVTVRTGGAQQQGEHREDRE